MRKFKFASLLGVKPKAMEDEEPKAAEDTEAPAEDTEAEGEAEPETEKAEDMPAEDYEGEDEAEGSEAYRRGVAAGRKAERERCAAIFVHATPATAAQAANLAFNTSVSPTDAKAILDAAPRASRLDALMAGKNPPAPKAAGGGASASADDEAAKRILRAAGKVKEG